MTEFPCLSLEGMGRWIETGACQVKQSYEVLIWGCISSSWHGVGTITAVLQH